MTAKVNGHSVPDGWPQEGSLSFTSLMKDKRPVTIGNQLSSEFLPF